MYIRLFPETSKLCRDQPPIARFVLRVSSSGGNRKPIILSGNPFISIPYRNYHPGMLI